MAAEQHSRRISESISISEAELQSEGRHHADQITPAGLVWTGWSLTYPLQHTGFIH